MRFFALHMTVEPKIPGAVIPPGVFTQPGSFSTGLRDRRHVGFALHNRSHSGRGQTTFSANCKLPHCKKKIRRSSPAGIGRDGPILLKKSVSNLRLAGPGYSKALDCEALTVSGWVSAWHRYQLRQLSEVLGGCCEKELITGTIRPS